MTPDPLGGPPLDQMRIIRRIEVALRDMLFNHEMQLREAHALAKSLLPADDSDLPTIEQVSGILPPSPHPQRQNESSGLMKVLNHVGGFGDIYRCQWCGIQSGLQLPAFPHQPWCPTVTLRKRDDECARLRAQVEPLQAELRSVDHVLDRRDALAAFETRVDKILHLIRVASTTDPRAEIGKVEAQLTEARAQVEERKEIHRQLIALTREWQELKDENIELRAQVEAAETWIPHCKNCKRAITRIDLPAPEGPEMKGMHGWVHVGPPGVFCVVNPFDPDAGRPTVEPDDSLICQQWKRLDDARKLANRQLAEARAQMERLTQERDEVADELAKRLATTKTELVIAGVHAKALESAASTLRYLVGYLRCDEHWPVKSEHMAYLAGAEKALEAAAQPLAAKEQ